MASRIITVLIILLSSSSLAISAGIPQLINYQGMLTDDAGNPLNEPRDLTFTIYDAPTNGTALWTETHTAVPIEDGLFNVIMGGETTPIPDSVFNEPERFLGIKVGSDPELRPRIQLTSVGYAYRAHQTDYAQAAGTAETDGDWTISSNNVYSAVSGDVGIGTTSPAAKLHVERPATGDVILAKRTDTQQGLKLWFHQPSGKAAIQATGGVDDLLLNADGGNVGIGTSSPTRKLTVDGGDAIIKGGDGWNGSGDDAVLYLGDPNHGIRSVYGQGLRIWTFDDAISDIRFRGHTGTDYMTIQMGSGKVGIGTISPGAKLHVLSTSQGDSLGIYGESNVLAGYGVCGRNTSSGVGVWGEGWSGGTGVYGLSPDGGIGVFGMCNNGAGVQGYSYSGLAVVGLSETGYAGYFDGNVYVTGNNPRILIEAETGNPEVNFMSSGDPSSEVWALYKDTVSNDLRFYQWGDKVTLQNSTGYVGIGTTNPGYKLDVNGDINVSGSYNVKKGGTNYTHPDYVFESDYELMSLGDLKEYVSEKKCLPNVISAEDVKNNNGFKMDKLLIQMLEKIEEQTLYIFQLEERIAALESKE